MHGVRMLLRNSVAILYFSWRMVVAFEARGHFAGSDCLGVS